MEKSLRLRKQQMLNWVKERKLLATGGLRLEQISLAAALGMGISNAPLILRRVKLEETDGI